MILLQRIKMWLAVAIGLAAAALGIWLKGRQAGKQAQGKQVIHAHEVRDEIEAKNAKLPDATAQRVGDADPDTAAGKLRDDGWMRGS